MLKRAIRTLWIVLDEMDRMWIPVERDWRLNERHYGALQGLDKAETTAKYGAEQVKVWRRSYDIPPPPLAADDPRHPRFDARYRAASTPRGCRRPNRSRTRSRASSPGGASGSCPRSRAGGDVLVVAHGNSLRALVKMLDGMSDADIVEFNIPTGVPILYELDGRLRPRAARRFLGDAAAIEAAARAVAAQAGKKGPLRRASSSFSGAISTSRPASGASNGTWQDSRDPRGRKLSSSCRISFSSPCIGGRRSSQGSAT